MEQMDATLAFPSMPVKALFSWVESGASTLL